jgi:hypothetical protein
MDAFSHLSVLLSIIIGLAITQVLQGFGLLFQGRQRVRWYWPALLWMGLLLLIYVQSWWAMFGLRNVPSWNFGSFAVVLLQTVLEYVTAALIAPASFQAGDVDLRAHYFEQARPFFLTMIGVLLASLAKDLALGGIPRGANLDFHLVWIALMVTALISKNELLHKVFTLVSAVTIVSYVVLLFTRLP